MERSYGLLSVVVFGLGVLIAACTGPLDDDDTAAELGPQILTEDLPVAQVQLPYAATIEVTDVEGEVEIDLIGGELPPGLTLDQTGLIEGEPQAQGEFGFTIIAQDHEGETAVDLTLRVAPVVLMSGFEPFGGYPTNPSIDSLWPMDEQLVADLDVRVVELPVVWDVAWQELLVEIELLQPAVVIGTGMAGDEAIQFETNAVNEQWGSDNDGVYRAGDPIVEDGPESMGSGLPVVEMAAAVGAAGFDAQQSSNAGTYLCNDLFYHIVHYAEFEAPEPVVGGFVHVPPAPYGPVFTVEDVTSAHEAALAALATWLDSDRVTQRPRVDSRDDPVYFGLNP